MEPLKGLNLFSRSNSCLPSLDRSMRRSGQMAYSSSVRLTWWIFSITVSGDGPATRHKKFMIQDLFPTHSLCSNYGSWCAGLKNRKGFKFTAKKTRRLPPFATLNLIPKSPPGPPGLWLAVRTIPPMALIFLMMQETAGVDRRPLWPITSRPICTVQINKEWWLLYANRV